MADEKPYDDGEGLKCLKTLIDKHGIQGTKEVLRLQGWTSFTDPEGSEIFTAPGGNGSVTFKK